MPSINQLNAADQLSGSDLLALYSQANGDARKISLTNLMNWDKLFDSPFKSDVYFFSTRLQLDRKWGTPNPVTIRDKDFGAVRLRAFGIYSYRIADPKLFHKEVSGTRESYTVADLDGHLRNSMIAAMTIDSPDLSLGSKVCLAARKHGLLTRPIGNTIVLMPPLCVTLDEIERMVAALRSALDEITPPECRTA